MPMTREDLMKWAQFCKEQPNTALQYLSLPQIWSAIKYYYGEESIYPYIDKNKFVVNLRGKEQLHSEFSVDSGNLILIDPKNILGKDNLPVRKRIMAAIKDMEDRQLPYPEGHAGLGTIIKVPEGVYKVFKNERNEIKIVEK